MTEVEKTCENCEYELEDIEGTHCRHCIHNAIEQFKPKEIHYTEQEIRNKAIDEFTRKAIAWNHNSTKKVPYEFIEWVAEQMKGK